jgi:hypothetical protein
MATGAMMCAYGQISARFPHLNLEGIISFERKLRDAHDRIMVHSGEYKLVERRYTSNHYEDTSWEVSWSCCSNEGMDSMGRVVRYYSCANFGGEPCPFDVDDEYKWAEYDNPDPASMCDHPVRWLLSRGERRVGELEDVAETVATFDARIAAAEREIIGLRKLRDMLNTQHEGP